MSKYGNLNSSEERTPFFWAILVASDFVVASLNSLACSTIDFSMASCFASWWCIVAHTSTSSLGAWLTLRLKFASWAAKIGWNWVIFLTAGRSDATANNAALIVHSSPGTSGIPFHRSIRSSTNGCKNVLMFCGGSWGPGITPTYTHSKYSTENVHDIITLRTCYDCPSLLEPFFTW